MRRYCWTETLELILGEGAKADERVQELGKLEADGGAWQRPSGFRRVGNSETVFVNNKHMTACMATT